MVRLPVLLQNCFFSEGGGYELNLPTTVPDNTPFSRFPRPMSAVSVQEG